MLFSNLLQLNNCLFCQIDSATQFGVCNFCEKILPWITNLKYKCAKCHKELTFHEKLLCIDCKTIFGNCNQIFSIFSYQDPIKKIILDLKFKKNLAYADFLGKILYEFVLNKWYKYKSLPEILIPVPLHQDRLRSRGFNQTFELTKQISKKIKINNTSCLRIKNTVQQTRLLKTSRNINIKHAFVSEKLNHKHIAILDDVITTGSTIKSLSQAIKKTNPQIIIDILSIARA